MVAASFQATQAKLSLTKNGNTPPNTVGAVESKPPVLQPGTGLAQPWYSVAPGGGDHTGG